MTVAGGTASSLSADDREVGPEEQGMVVLGNVLLGIGLFVLLAGFWRFARVTKHIARAYQVPQK